MTSRHWLSFGIGPQIAQNYLKMNADSQAYIHKHLWDNKDIVTHNGIGLNSFITYAYKFGKKNRFSFETGLNYSFRTENIQINESTYEIAVRKNNQEIVQYLNLRVWISPNPGDTTFYNAAQSFTMLKKNRYNVFTLPFRINSEHKITDNTFFMLGVGGGISMMSGKDISHYNLVYEREDVVAKHTQFSASLNTRLSLYTNFNNMGQVGIYGGVQSYLQPWEIQNLQYKIKMQDIQFGIVFRKPL
jgi:hypothetical protein